MTGTTPHRPPSTDGYHGWCTAPIPVADLEPGDHAWFETPTLAGHGEVLRHDGAHLLVTFHDGGTPRRGALAVRTLRAWGLVDVLLRDAETSHHIGAAHDLERALYGGDLDTVAQLRNELADMDAHIDRVTPRIRELAQPRGGRLDAGTLAAIEALLHGGT